MGWPEEWPSQSDRGHFRISEGEWLGENDENVVGNDENDGDSATEISAILIPANDVEMVEFIESVDGKSQPGIAGTKCRLAKIFGVLSKTSRIRD